MRATRSRKIGKFESDSETRKPVLTGKQRLDFLKENAVSADRSAGHRTNAWREYQLEQQAQRENMEHLRALRLAKRTKETGEAG